MRRRRVVGLALLLTLVVLAASRPSVHYPVLGFLRRDTFFQGMPASYWSMKLREERNPTPPSLPALVLNELAQGRLPDFAELRLSQDLGYFPPSISLVVKSNP